MITLPIWYLVLAAVLLLILGTRVGVGLYGTLLGDRRSIGIVTGTSQEWLQAVAAQKAAGEEPWGMTLSPRLLRAFFPGGLIINCPHPEDLARIGSPAAFITHVKSQPVPLAHMLAGVLRTQREFVTGPGAGSVDVFDNLDPDLPPQRLAFVKTHLPFLLGFRRHALMMGGKPPKWNQKEAEKAARDFDS